MCQFPIMLTFLTFRHDFEKQAHVFRTWSVGHKIFKLKNCTTCKNIGGEELIVVKLLWKNRKNAVFTHTGDPCGSPEIITTKHSMFLFAQSLLLWDYTQSPISCMAL